MKELVQLTFDKIMQTRAYTVIILSGQGKRFAIYTEAETGKLLQMYLTGNKKPRPMTHDLMSSILKGFNIRIKHISITDIQDTIYFARLFLEQWNGEIREIIELDARPSDCILLALINNIPVFCTQEVLHKAVPIED